MGPGLYVIFFAVSFGASVAGAICGIGGGILIKPLLDTFGVLSVSAISFLSGCTVLSMSCYSVIREKLGGGSLIDSRIGTPLAIGAALGGIVGKNLFSALLDFFAGSDRVGAVQAAALLVITFATLIYTINRNRIKTYRFRNAFICILTGLALGICSSFLGIGGGPVNLVVLYFFFSMDTKSAAQNSLYIILFSQTASLLNTVITRTVPDFGLLILLLMIAGGIFGGICGRRINSKISPDTVNRLFMILMVLIMVICARNFMSFV